MKKVILSAIILMSHMGFSATLQCWKTDFKQARVPYMSAVIEDHHVVSNIRYYYKEEGKVPQSPGGFVVGQLITTNRSPYQGMNNFNVATGAFGNSRLILPTNLSNRNLQKLASAHSAGENAVIIGSFSGDGGHYSVRLFCVSN